VRRSFSIEGMCDQYVAAFEKEIAIHGSTVAAV
jgi:hypothetical protein